MLLQELRKIDAINEKTLADESARLEVLAKDKFAITLSAADLGLIVQTQRVQWFAKSLHLVGIWLGLIVAIPLLRNLFREVFPFLTRKLREVFLPLWERLWPNVLVFLQAVRRLWNELVDGLVKLLLLAPIWIYEALGYLAIGWLLLVQRNEYVAIVGALLLPLLAFFSLRRHTGALENETLGQVGAAAFALWTVATFLHSSNILGFMSVAALLYWLGFAIDVFPGAISFGFREHSVEVFARTCFVSLFLLIFAWLAFYTQAFAAAPMLEKYFGYFRYGVFSLGSTAYYVSLLVLSGYWFRQKNFYLIANLAAIVSGVLFLAVSFFYEIGFHFWVCVFYLVFLFADKYYTYIFKRIGWVWGGAVASAVFSAGGWWINAHLARMTVFLAPFLP